MTRRQALRRCIAQLPRDLVAVALEPCDDAYHYAVRDVVQAHVRVAWRRVTWVPETADG